MSKHEIYESIRLDCVLFHNLIINMSTSSSFKSFDAPDMQTARDSKPSLKAPKLRIAGRGINFEFVCPNKECHFSH